MKRIILNIFLATAALTSVGCSKDYLEENYYEAGLIPIDEIAILNKADLERAVRGLYTRLADNTTFAGDYLTYQELTADIGFVSISNSGYFVGTNGGTHITVDGGAGGPMWSAFYNVIASSNFVLSYDGKIADSDEGETSVKRLFTHAKIVRAYNYMALLNLFSPNYGEGDQSLGVPYSTVFDYKQKLPRESVGTVTDNIIQDLLTSLEVITDPTDYSSQQLYTDNHSFGAGAVKLLLARMYLYKKDYAKAAEYAQAVLDDGDSSLLPRNQVNSFFGLGGEKNPETLFQLDFNTTVLQTISDYWGSSGAYKQNYMNRDFWSSFPSTDIRRNTWYGNSTYVEGLGDAPKPIEVKKYISQSRDVVQLRKSEAVFILAEAQYHSDPALAATTLKTWVKTYRDTGYNKTLTGTDVLDEILRQKGFEFFLEGMRFSDLKRNNRDIVKMQKDVSTGQPLTVIPAGDRRFVWPVPLHEMQSNPYITQAPGY